LALEEPAALIEAAVSKVLGQKVLTRDLGGQANTADVEKALLSAL